MRMYNTTLEQFDVQCNSKVFKFAPRKSTNVPDDLIPFMEERLRDKGVFAVKYHMGKEDIKKAAREALKNYLHGILRERLINYAAQHDQFKKQGVTLENDAWHERSLRWDKEIRALLNIESPLEEELSFLDETQRKQLGMTINGLAHVPQDLFSDEQMANMIIKEAGNPVPEGDELAALDAEISKAFQPEATEAVKRKPIKKELELQEK